MPKGKRDDILTEQNDDTRRKLSEAAEQFSRQAETTKDAKLAAVAQAVRALNEKQKEFYRRDSHGTYPAYTAEDNEEMLRLYENALQQVSAYTAQEKAPSLLIEENADPEDDPLRAAAEYLQNLLTRDKNHLLRFDPAQNDNFPELLNSARSVTVDTTGKTLSLKGANQSTRIPMTVTGSNGKPITGFFTPESRLQGIEKRFDDLMKQIEERFPAATVFDDILDNFTQKLNDGASFLIEGEIDTFPPQDSRSEYIYRFFACCRDKRHHLDIRTMLQNFAEMTDRTVIDIADNQQNLQAMDYFCQKAKAFLVMEHLSDSQLHLKPGERLDSRNTAMSTVAGLLGRPELICRAVSMTAIINGEKVKGTFMETAKGVDPNNPDREIINYQPKDDKIPEALRDVADLQVIDYICGNLDRHGANYFYRFGEKNGVPHLTGLVGIDNDSSFGAGTELYEENKNKLVGTNNMRVVSRSMADKVLNLSVETLRYSLRTYDLSEDSIRAACDRLAHLKTCIIFGEATYDTTKMKNKLAQDPSYTQPGLIRVVPDEDFDKLDIKKLIGEDRKPKRNRTARKDPAKNGDAPQKKSSPPTNNLFNRIYSFSIDITNIRDRAPRTPETMRNINRFTCDGMLSSAEEVGGLIKRLNKATNIRGSSDNYRNMVTALTNLQKTLKETAKQPPDFGCINPINKALGDLKKACDTYLTNKKAQKDLSDYAKNRIALAEEVMQFAKDSVIDIDKLSEPEKIQLRHNEEQNIEKLNREAAKNIPAPRSLN